MPKRPSTSRKAIPRRTVFVAAILLVGVLLMAYGYYHDIRVIVYVGLALTGMAAINGIAFSVIWPSAPGSAPRRR